MKKLVFFSLVCVLLVFSYSCIKKGPITPTPPVVPTSTPTATCSSSFAPVTTYSAAVSGGPSTNPTIIQNNVQWTNYWTALNWSTIPTAPVSFSSQMLVLVASYSPMGLFVGINSICYTNTNIMIYDTFSYPGTYCAICAPSVDISAIAIPSSSLPVTYIASYFSGI